MGRSVKKVPGTEGYRTVMSHIIDDDCHGYTTFTQKTKGVSATSFVRVTICVPLHLFGEHENSVLESSYFHSSVHRRRAPFRGANVL